jgi:hypothetical protein
MSVQYGSSKYLKSFVQEDEDKDEHVKAKIRTATGSTRFRRV